MQNIVHVLSENIYAYSFLLFIGAAYPSCLGLGAIFLSYKDFGSLFPIRASLEVLLRATLGNLITSLVFISYLIGGISSLLAPPAVQLVLHLSSLLGLLVGVILGALLPPLGEPIFWGFISLPGYPFFAFSALRHVMKKLLMPHRLDQNTSPFIPPLWDFLFPIPFLIIYTIYSFLIELLTNSSEIGLWSTFISVPITCLLLFYFLLVQEVIFPSIADRSLPSLAKALINVTRYAAIAPLALFCPLSLLFLALIGGLIGSFLL